jgi:hypothetical protein
VINHILPPMETDGALFVFTVSSPWLVFREGRREHSLYMR